MMAKLISALELHYPKIQFLIIKDMRYAYRWSGYIAGARSIQPKFRPVRPGKEDHLKRWTCFFETFSVGPNRSIEFWTEISGNFVWMDRAHWMLASRLDGNIFILTKSQIFLVRAYLTRSIMIWPLCFWIFLTERIDFSDVCIFERFSGHFFVKFS